MIICDGKHKDPVEGQAAFNLRGTTQVGDATVRLDIRLQAEGKQFCSDCFIEELLKKIDFAKLAKEGAKAQEARQTKAKR